MSYVRAEDVLPKELIETIQQYVNGTNIYIPCLEKKVWGSQTVTKQYYKIRNCEICKKYEAGITTRIHANEYSLSIKSIQRIIRTNRNLGILSDEK